MKPKALRFKSMMWVSIPLQAGKQASKQEKKHSSKSEIPPLIQKEGVGGQKKTWKENPSGNSQINAIQRYALEENQPQLVTTTNSGPLGESPELHTNYVTALHPNETLKWTKVHIIIHLSTSLKNSK
jgi:hypothetical protein